MLENLENVAKIYGRWSFIAKFETRDFSVILGNKIFEIKLNLNWNILMVSLILTSDLRNVL